MSARRLGTMLPGEKDPVVQVVVRPPCGLGAHQPLQCQKESNDLCQYTRCFLDSDPWLWRIINFKWSIFLLSLPFTVLINNRCRWYFYSPCLENINIYWHFYFGPLTRSWGKKHNHLYRHISTHCTNIRSSSIRLNCAQSWKLMFRRTMPAETYTAGSGGARLKVSFTCVIFLSQQWAKWHGFKDWGWGGWWSGDSLKSLCCVIFLGQQQSKCYEDRWW